MRKTLENRPTLEEYIDEQMNEAKELGNSSCTLFAVNEQAMEEKLREKHLKFITPRVGQYIVFV
jgi:hypothetical protein